MNYYSIDLTALSEEVAEVVKKKLNIVSIDKVTSAQVGKIAMAIKDYHVRKTEDYAKEDLRKLGLVFRDEDVKQKENEVSYFATRVQRAVENVGECIARKQGDIMEYCKRVNEIESALKRGEVSISGISFPVGPAQEKSLKETRLALLDMIEKLQDEISEFR